MQKHFLDSYIYYKQMLIIGIAGGTGSGKTTVVRKIIESLPVGEVVLLLKIHIIKIVVMFLLKKGKI